MAQLIGGHTVQPTEWNSAGQLYLGQLLALRSWRLCERYWSEMSENAVAQQIVDAAYRVHTTLGPGLLESVYEAALAYELEKRGLHLTRQQAVPVIYEAVHIHTGFHADLVVENQVIVEIKALEAVAPVHKKQLLTYLKLADKRLGLLINFNVALIKDGITRIVNGLEQ
jgi:GxxExxY protein